MIKRLIRKADTDIQNIFQGIADNCTQIERAVDKVESEIIKTMGLVKNNETLSNQIGQQADLMEQIQTALDNVGYTLKNIDAIEPYSDSQININNQENEFDINDIEDEENIEDEELSDEEPEESEDEESDEEDTDESEDTSDSDEELSFDFD